MADAHTRLFHELMEPLLRVQLNGTQFRILLWVARNSYGRSGARFAPCTWGQIARDLGADRTRVSREGRAMLSLGVLRPGEEGEIGIDKDRVKELGGCENARGGAKTHPSENAPQSVTKTHPHSYKKEKRKSAVPAQSTEPKPKDPNVKAIIDYFSQRCQELRGFKPAIAGGKDGATINRALADGDSPEVLKTLVDWFLRSKKADELGVALSTALSAHSRNLFRQQQGRTSSDDAAARTRAYLQQTEAA